MPKKLKRVLALRSDFDRPTTSNLKIIYELNLTILKQAEAKRKAMEKERKKKEDKWAMKEKAAVKMELDAEPKPHICEAHKKKKKEEEEMKKAVKVEVEEEPHICEAHKCCPFNLASPPSTAEVIRVFSPFESFFNGRDEDLVAIGPNLTIVKRGVLKAIKWSSCSFKDATRQLLDAIFGSDYLARHSYSGEKSNKPLDPRKVQDIEYIITNRFLVPVIEVRKFIKLTCITERRASWRCHRE